jgi:4,5-DOPA dioxygenase extradiol
LREKGVLILASGNVVHNLRATDRVPGLSPTSTRPWAQTFDAAVNRALSQRNDVGLLSYWSLAGDTASVAVETPDHYFPLLYALCASDPQTEPGVSVFEGFQAGTISMRCVQFGS